MTNLKSKQNSINQIFNSNEFFSFLLKDATWYGHAIYILFRYVASFTGYEDDIIKIISNLCVQGSKFGGKFDKLVGKSF